MASPPHPYSGKVGLWRRVEHNYDWTQAYHGFYMPPLSFSLPVAARVQSGWSPGELDNSRHLGSAVEAVAVVALAARLVAAA